MWIRSEHLVDQEALRIICAFKIGQKKYTLQSPGKDMRLLQSPACTPGLQQCCGWALDLCSGPPALLCKPAQACKDSPLHWDNFHTPEQGLHCLSRSYHLPSWGRQNNGFSKGMYFLILGTCECHLIWQKGLCRCDRIKPAKMGRLSWII